MGNKLSSASSAGAWLWWSYGLWLLLRKLLLWLPLTIYWTSYIDCSSSWSRFNLSNTKLTYIKWLSLFYIGFNLYPWTCCIATSKSSLRLLLVLPSWPILLRIIQLFALKISTLYNPFVIFGKVWIMCSSDIPSDSRFALLFWKGVSWSLYLLYLLLSRNEFFFRILSTHWLKFLLRQSSILG